MYVLRLGKGVWWGDGVPANAHCVQLQPQRLPSSCASTFLFYLTLLICIQMPLCQPWSEVNRNKNARLMNPMSSRYTTHRWREDGCNQITVGADVQTWTQMSPTWLQSLTVCLRGW